MKAKHNLVSGCSLMVSVALLFLAACNSGSSNNGPNANEDPAEPLFSQAVFTNPTQVDNPYLPMIPDRVQVYQVETEDEMETVVVEVLAETRSVAGVTSAVVRDRVFVEEMLIEDTYDWYAQDDNGHVWYMGEDVVNYEYDDDGNVISTDNEGAWEAGVDGAMAGIIMKATLGVGDIYQQEFYPGQAEDMAEIVAIGIEVELEDGTTFTNCLQTLEWNPLESDSEEYKYYAPNIGLLREEHTGGEETAELKGVFLTGMDQLPDFEAATFTAPTTIDNLYWPLTPGTTMTYVTSGEDNEDGVETIITEVLTTTRVVSGVMCVVFRDRVYLDGLLIEDTHDWYAQDDNGHVWYMGEDVVNYEYDEDDNLLDTNGDGAWEAGIDDALPGIIMWAAPAAGISYYQEYYADEAEDMGFIVAVDVSVELGNGTVYDSCIQILDWNPLEPAALEYKYFAPGVGLVKEEEVGGDEVMELI